ncbi:hypothetical protein D3C71_1798360 [compost metagenome]
MRQDLQRTARTGWVTCRIHGGDHHLHGAVCQQGQGIGWDQRAPGTIVIHDTVHHVGTNLDQYRGVNQQVGCCTADWRSDPQFGNIKNIVTEQRVQRQRWQRMGVDRHRDGV